jgi:hypothetical protein
MRGRAGLNPIWLSACGSPAHSTGARVLSPHLQRRAAGRRGPQTVRSMKNQAPKVRWLALIHIEDSASPVVPSFFLIER